MSIGFNPVFERYEIPREGPFPKEDLSGCIAFTRDTQHVGWIHILIHLTQKIHKFIFRRDADANLCHAMVLLDSQPGEDGRIVLAHSTFSGIRTSKRNYLAEKDVTSLVIYRPKDDKLRKRIAKYARQTSRNKCEAPSEQEEKKGKFSIKDMILAFFRNKNETTEQHSVKTRLSRSIVDLLQGRTLCDRKGNPRDLFCSAYAVFILQSSQLIAKMTKEEKNAVKAAKSTDEAVKTVLNLLNNAEHPVGNTYKEHNFLKIDAQYAMSGYSCQQLNKVSGEKRVSERVYPFPLDQFNKKHRIVDVTENWKSDEKIETENDKTSETIERLHHKIGKRSTLAKVKRVVIPILYAMTIFGIGKAIRFNRMYKAYSMQKKFMEEAGKKDQPQIAENIQLHSKTMTFNHIANYVIHEGIIWTKSRVKEGAEWEPVYFSGYPNRTPKELHADGANLVVIDDKDFVHYKKVIGEKCDDERNTYIYYDKSTKNNWKNEWYSFPYLKHIVNFFTGKKLKLLEGCRSWAISHRGQLSRYSEDGDLNQHITFNGVTTLFVLDKEGRHLYLFDPWKPKHVLVKVPVPETSGSSFVAERISAAGSVVALVGYAFKNERAYPAIKTMVMDIDTLGWNPYLDYTYDSENRTNDERILPTVEKWDDHFLPEGATTNITVVQTGKGNNAKELRVAAEYQGKKGYWTKSLEGGNWRFCVDNHVDLGERLEEKGVNEEPVPNVKNWKNENAFLENFSCYSLLGELTCNNNKFLLLRRDNIILQVVSGKEHYYYDLVDKATGKVRKVKIVQHENSLKIIERGVFKRKPFKLTLHRS